MQAISLLVLGWFSYTPTLLSFDFFTWSCWIGPFVCPSQPQSQSQSYQIKSPIKCIIRVVFIYMVYYHLLRYIPLVYWIWMVFTFLPVSHLLFYIIYIIGYSIYTIYRIQYHGIVGGTIRKCLFLKINPLTPAQH